MSTQFYRNEGIMRLMPWFKVDDNLAFHHKTVAAGVSAMGLWVRAGSWCAHTLTDGFVPEHMVPALADGDASLAGRLVEAGLWRRVKGGFTFHEWADRQPSRQSIENLRAARSDAGRNGGVRSGQVRRGERSNSEASASSKSEANLKQVASGCLNSRPGPGLSRGTSGGGSHESNARAKQAPPQRPRCKQHQHIPDHDPGPPCHGCKAEREAAEQRKHDEHTAELAAGQSWRGAVEACPDCDENGWVETDHGLTQHHPRPGETHLRSVS